MTKKTATIVLTCVKDPDGWGDLAHELGLSAETRGRFFEFGEVANLELVIDEDMNIVGGRVLPVKGGEVMSLDIDLLLDPCPHCGRSDGGVFSANITYNLGPMWRAAGLPFSVEEIEGKRASELVPWLEAGLAELVNNSATYKAMNPSNGWGSFEGLVKTVAEMLAAVRQYPDAVVRTSR
jgi:hypothetical protein